MTRSELFEQVMKPRLRAATVLWAAFTVSMFVYLIVVFTQVRDKAPLPVNQTVLMAAYAVGAVLALVSLVIRLTAFSDDRISTKMRIPADQSRFGLDAKTGKVDEELKGKLLRLSDKEQRVVALFDFFYKSFFLCIMFNEVMVIIGLIVAYLYQQPGIMYPFLGAGVVLNLTHARTLRSVIERAFKVA